MKNIPPIERKKCHIIGASHLIHWHWNFGTKFPCVFLYVGKGRQNTQIGMNQNTCQPVWFIGMPEIGMPTWIKSRSTFQGLSASIVVVWALVVWRWASPGPEMIIIFPMIWCPKGAGHLSDTPRRTLWFSSSHWRWCGLWSRSPDVRGGWCQSSDFDRRKAVEKDGQMEISPTAKTGKLMKID